MSFSPTFSEELDVSSVTSGGWKRGLGLCDEKGRNAQTGGARGRVVGHSALFSMKKTQT